MNIVPLHEGGSSDLCRQVQAAAGRRLRARDLDRYAPAIDGDCGPQTIEACAKAAWALGALLTTVTRIRQTRTVPVGVIRMILNPGRRTDEQQARGKARIADMRAARAARDRRESGVSDGRLKVVKLCLLAAENYRANPSAYHYLAGGKANLVFLKPTPRDWRSDCSQFASSVQHEAGLPDLGPNGPLWVNTWVMDAHLQRTDSPLPGDFGMYGPVGDPHHVEVYLGQAGLKLGGAEFIGHGSPPIDSLTPGRPSYYLRNPLAT